jgi:hypothetical protein
MLTYDRLLARMQTLSGTATTHFDGERLVLLKRTIKSVVKACEAGLRGNQDVLSPGQLKHWMERNIKTIHAQFDEPLQEQHASATNKRKRTATADAPAKRQKRATPTPMGDGEVRQVAAGLLALCSSSPPSTPPYSTKALSPPAIDHDKLRIDGDRKIYTPFPVVDRKKGPKPTFLAGVQYAMDNIHKHGTNHATFTANFPEYVRAELGIEKMAESRVQRTASEVTAAEGLLGMMGGRTEGHSGGWVAEKIRLQASHTAGNAAGHVGGQATGLAVSKSFWNVI